MYCYSIWVDAFVLTICSFLPQLVALLLAQRDGLGGTSSASSPSNSLGASKNNAPTTDKPSDPIHDEAHDLQDGSALAAAYHPQTMTPQHHNNSFTRDFISRLQKVSLDAKRRNELPGYDYGDVADLGRLVSKSRPRSFRVGTGASIYSQMLLPALLEAKHEVVLVTCFWARSKTLDWLRQTLEALAAHRRGILDRDVGALPILRVRICFSSRSLLQKLLHTSSRDGYTYPPSTWAKTLGLAHEQVLTRAGIDLEVKSLFFLPLSVMHPKLLIIDRERAFVPSCNISWERWLEGCVELEGDAVLCLLAFYSRTWDPSLDLGNNLRAVNCPSPSWGAPAVRSAATISVALSNSNTDGAERETETETETVTETVTETETTILPSSHHQNPHFRLFPWQPSPKPPKTPLNLAVLQLFETAQQHIYMQTPNLTCKRVLSALLDALGRGVDVKIITSRNLMIMEQLVTAGTTTSLCVRSLVRRYKALRSRHSTYPLSSAAPADGAGSPPGSRGSLLPLQRRLAPDENPSAAERGVDGGGDGGGDCGVHKPGTLHVSYFRPLHPLTRRQHRAASASASDREQALDDDAEEPVHSHLKLTIVDGRYTLLGSGNMDRASWFTSQELGILFHGADFAHPVKGALDQVLEGRLDNIYDSEA